MLPGQISPWNLFVRSKSGQYMASFKPRRVVACGGWMGMAIIQLPQHSKAGTWAELGNIFQLKTKYSVFSKILVWKMKWKCVPSSSSSHGKFHFLTLLYQLMPKKVQNPLNLQTFHLHVIFFIRKCKFGLSLKSFLTISKIEPQTFLILMFFLAQKLPIS